MHDAELLTNEKAEALFQRIAKGIEESKISRSSDVIVYAMKEAWMAGLEDGRKDREGGATASDLVPSR